MAEPLKKKTNTEEDPYLKPDSELSGYKSKPAGDQAARDLAERKRSNAQRRDNALKNGDYEDGRDALSSAREIAKQEDEAADPKKAMQAKRQAALRARSSN